MQADKRDVFISYKNDGIGNNFAARLANDIESAGFSVYFNPKESNSKSFPEKLKNAVVECKDFILILSYGCISQLCENKETDWIRTELLLAKDNNKNIIPLLMDGTEMPQDKGIFPKNIQFLADIDAISVPKAFNERYHMSPFNLIMDNLSSLPEKDDIYRDVDNSNEKYNIAEDMAEVKKQADKNDIKSIYELAIMYYFNFSGVKRDYDTAFRYFKNIVENEENKENKSEYYYSACSMIGRPESVKSIPIFGQQKREQFLQLKTAA